MHELAWTWGRSLLVVRQICSCRLVELDLSVCKMPEIPSHRLRVQFLQMPSCDVRYATSGRRSDAGTDPHLDICVIEF